LLGKNIVGMYLSGLASTTEICPEREDLDLEAVVRSTDAEKGKSNG